MRARAHPAERAELATLDRHATGPVRRESKHILRLLQAIAPRGWTDAEGLETIVGAVEGSDAFGPAGFIADQPGIELSPSKRDACCA